MPLAQADPTVSDFINTLWSNQKNKSLFIGSYMVMELFPHKLKFAFLSLCHHVDCLFCSCSRKRNFLLPRAQTHISGEVQALHGVKWRRHDSLLYATFSACNCHWWCGITCRVVNRPTALNNLFSWWFGYVILRFFFNFSFLRDSFTKSYEFLKNQSHLSGRIQSRSPPAVECLRSTDLSSGSGVGWHGWRWEGLNGWVTWSNI